MRVELEDTDYRIFLSEENITELNDRKPSGIGLDIFPRYRPLSAKFTDNNGDIRELQIVSTRDAFILSDKNTHDNIFVDFDNLGPYVQVYAPRLASLLFGTDYLVTRYNAEARIWIHKEDRVISHNDGLVQKVYRVYGVSM